MQVTRRRVEANGDERKRALRKTGLYKTFVDEVMPLAICADHLCEPDDRILPVLGNQGYDAVIFGPLGLKKGRVEIAKPFDGKSEAEDVKALEQDMPGKLRSHDFGGELNGLLTHIIETAKKKSNKDYSDCTLLIVAAINPPFDQELSRLEKSVSKLSSQLKDIDFKAKRVILVVPPLSKAYVIHS